MTRMARQYGGRVVHPVLAVQRERMGRSMADSSGDSAAAAAGVAVRLAET